MQTSNFYLKPYLKWFSLGVITLLATLYILAPFIIKYYLNHRVLNNMGAYSGHINDVDLNIIDGEYQLKQLVITRDKQNTRTEFFTVETFAIALSWEGLRHGEILTRVKLTKPELTFLDADKKTDQQTGKGTNWLGVFEEILPVTLHELIIHDGIIRFKNLDTTPKVDLALKAINAKLSNLTNVKDSSGQRVAHATFDGLLFGNSKVSAKADFDPFNFNDFEFAADAHDIRLNRLNDFSQAYANIDFKSGHGQIFIELSAQDRNLSGYVKPLFEDINIVSWKQDVSQQQDNPLQLLWEASWGGLSVLLTSIDSGKLATQIDINGSLEQTSISSWQALFGVLHNAFIDALAPHYEKLTPLTQKSWRADELPALNRNS
ncbi:DUF748 domain-containing protein [Gilvimarinus polysaccharolyticus]|uniref:DUF748 domain-containing protein n=1 Tax=Gilvimarinus polysaccharolyticus TaxID=863921 RepID=UPI00067387C5|nr:DUF748 domain-containing protein [Gilvimarinus polysaccharolyticus]